jgi:hypothetical protein
MATWKKVVVSGSNISQLNNDAGYLTSVTQQSTFVTASYDGTALIADSAQGNLTFASSSGQGLTITANPLNDTLTFGLNAIPNSSLANSTISGKSLGSNLDALTLGAGLTGTSYNGSAAVTATVDSSSLASYFATQSWTGITGDITINSSGVSAISSGVIVDNDINSAAGIVYTKLNLTSSGIVSGSSLSSAAQGEVVLTTNGVAGSTVDLGLQTGDSPQFVNLTLTGDAAVNGGDLTTTASTFNLVNANATTVNFAGAGTTVNIGNASGTTTIAGNAIVQGDFTVNGTTTYVNVQDLYVEDKFILLASGSANASDGGIIIDRGADAAGNIAYGYDSVTDRWGFQDGLTDSTNTFDPTSASGVSGSFVPYLFVEDNHGATKPTTGEFAVAGAMYVSTAGDFWIYA